LEEYRSTWVDLAQEPLDVVEAPGDRVLVSISSRGRGRESGVPIEIHFFEVLTVKDGQVLKPRVFWQSSARTDVWAVPPRVNL
jgi:ketosteroid isomerase-like protein